MASEVKILAALFGPSIPIEKAGILPEIMGHTRAIDDLLQGKPRMRARREDKSAEPAEKSPRQEGPLVPPKKEASPNDLW